MMLALAALLFLFTGAPQGTPAEPVKNSCISCHLDVGGDLAVPVEKVQNDVHGKHGLSCVNCHGGDATTMDMDRAMDPRKGFIKPSRRQVAAFCGKCHSNAETMKQFNPSLRVDQASLYLTSVHGKKVAEGDEKPATCISCHGNHGIVAVKDPTSPVYPTHVAETCSRCHADAEYMKPYKIPTDQYKKYRASVHGEALLKKQDISAPTCNTCHGNHGAAPPGTSSVANVCGNCHVRQSELFKTSPHQAAFETLGIAQCLACHGNHEIQHPTDILVGTTSGAKCVECHSKGDAGFDTASALHGRLIRLVTAIGDADSTLDRAAQAGMEVSHARFDLNGARDNLTNARVVIHGFSVETLEKATGPGMKIAEDAQQAGRNALGELLFRRKGLAVSLVVIALAIVAVHLKIRQIEA
jgi:hypothetical protein